MTERVAGFLKCKKMNKMKMFKFGFLTLMISLLFNLVNAQPISPQFFGQNAWMPDAIGSKTYGGKLHKNWKNIKESGVVMVRYGGTAVDQDHPTNSQYIQMIDSIRANGMEPMLQVSFHNWQKSAQDAANVVNYVNKTMNRNIKYWIIGNEPDLLYSFNSAGQVAAYIKAFATAMKNVDPTIKIIGPETAWYNTSIINGLTTANGPDDITGKDANGRYYIDYISFHTYPFNGSQSRSQVISKLAATGSFKDNLIALNQRVAACNTAHGRTGANAIKTAVTEANISYQNASGDDIYGVGTNSFIGGQFVAEMMCIAMEQGVQMFNLWSVIEGGTNSPTNIGYIDPATSNKKPLYHHYKMLAENFKGTMITATDNQNNVKTFASRSNGNVTVLLMNQDEGTSFNYTIGLSTAAVSGNSALKVNVNAAMPGMYTETLQPQSTVMLTFNSAGILIKKTEYSLSTQAAANLAPVVTNYNNLTTGDNEVSQPAAAKSFGISNIYPIPAVAKVTLQVEKGAEEANEDFQVQIFNVMGQEVMDRKLSFQGGKEEIELSPALASGEYFVRVKEGKKENFQVKKIVVQK